MVIKRGMNKKGEGEGPLSSTTGLVILGIFLVIAIVLIYKGYSGGTTTIARLSPDELSALKLRCMGYASIGTPIGQGDFCSFKQQTFDGKDGVANCQESTIFDVLKKDKDYGADVQGAYDACGSEKDNAKKYCDDLPSDKFKSLLVNGFACATWGSSGKKCSDILNPEKTPSEWKTKDTDCTGVSIKGKGTIVANSQIIDREGHAATDVCCMYPVGFKTSATPVTGTLEIGDVCKPDDTNSKCPTDSTCRYEQYHNDYICQSNSA